MKHGSAKSFQFIRLMALAAMLSASVSHADEYSNVNQLMRAGKLVEAQARVDRYLAAKPRDPRMRFIKGVIQRDSGQSEEAIDTFTKLSEDHPELPEPYNNLAVIYAGQSQFDKARAALEMAIRANPSYATAHENLGDVYAKLASQAYVKALQIDGTNTAVQSKLALIRALFESAPAGPQGATPAPTIEAAVTPPAPTMAATAQAATADGAAGEVEAAVRAWAKAWRDKDVGGYLGAYGQEFDPPGSLSRSAWEQERRLHIADKASISVNLLNLSVTIKGNRAVAKFQQDYKDDSLADLSRKTLELVKTGDRWLIVTETPGA